MKRLGVVLCVALVAVCVTGSVAQAEPTYFTCVKASPKNTGDYSAKTCSAASKVAGTGKYERASGVGVSFVSTTGEATLSTPGVGNVTCQEGAGAGKTISATEDEEATTFTECETTGIPCESVEPAGDAEGEISTFLLRATLGDIKAGEDGLDVEAFGGESEPSAFFHCGAEIFIRTTGDVIGKITSPVESAEPTASLCFAGNGTEQVPTHFEGGKESVLHTEIVGLGTFTSIEEVGSERSNGVALGISDGGPGTCEGAKGLPCKPGKVEETTAYKEVPLKQPVVMQVFSRALGCKVSANVAKLTRTKGAGKRAAEPFSIPKGGDTCSGKTKIDRCEVKVQFKPTAKEEYEGKYEVTFTEEGGAKNQIVVKDTLTGKGK